MRNILLVAATAVLCSTSSAEAATLDFFLAADLYQGPPHFQVIADDKIVLEEDVTSTVGQHFRKVLATIPKTLEIAFTNDLAAAGGTDRARDRNLIIKSVTVGDRTWTGLEMRPAVPACEPRGTDYVLCVNAQIAVPVSTATAPSAHEANLTPPRPVSFQPSPASGATGLQYPVFRKTGSKGALIAFIGDSLINGTGTDQSHAMPNDVSALLDDRMVEAFGQGGAPSSLIASNLLLQDMAQPAVAVIWVGRNNYGDPSSIAVDIAKIVATLESDSKLSDAIS
jgi:hypothetical protein